MASNEMIEFAKCANNPIYYMNTYGYVFDAGKKKVGRMTCFDYQNDCLQKFHEHRNNIILKSRQCLPESAYIDTPDGPKSIKDFKIGDKVYSYDLTSKEVKVDVVYDAWCSGDRQCVKFNLKDKRNFEVGENHPFYVKDIGWIKAKNLKVGDKIIDINLGFGEKKASNSDICEIEEFIENNFSSNDVFVPNMVFYWDKDSLSILMDKLFSINGLFKVFKKNGDISEIEINSKSLIFLQQLRNIFKKFNIKSDICNVSGLKKNKLKITQNSSISRFVNKILFYKNISESNYFCNEKTDDNISIIESVKKTNIKKCYDISVSENENFFVDGLLTHNTGLSVITAGYVAWRLLFRYDEKILIIANDGAGAVRFLKTVKDFIKHTPDWLKPDSVETDNTKKIEFSNNSWAEAKASSPNAGRGESLTMLVLDETAFIKDDDAIWMGASVALSQTRGKCIMISTPQGTGNLYYKTWIDAINADDSDFVATTVHWTENPNSSVGLEMKIDASGEEKPWSPWYESECKRLHWDSVKIAQELDLSFEGSKRLAIDPQLVSKYHNRVKDDKMLEGYIRYNYLEKDNIDKFGILQNEVSNMVIFNRPEVGKKYILGSDVARGDGKDYSTIQVLDVETLEQCAEFREKISPDLFPFVINHIAKMYNVAYVVIEANSFGLGVCFDIRDKFNYPRDRLYFSKNIKDIHVRHHKYKVNEGTEIPGFQTSRKNRVLLVKSIIEHMRENSLIVHSKRLTAEFQTFVMNGDKPEHEPGFNDDLIFALGLALYIRDTEFENVTASAEMYKSMLQAMMLNSDSSVGKVFDKSKKVDIQKGGGGLYIFNGDNNNINIGDSEGNIDDDLSWLLG